MSEDLTPLVAVGGNSRAARSARAKLQWRDRFGRWIEMGRGVKFKIRLPNGSTPSVQGTFVGAKDPETGQVYVKGDPNGLKDGFYDVKSGNAQEILASVDSEYLQSRGIEMGKDVAGNSVGSRFDKDIPNINEMQYSAVPEGWNVTKEDENGNPISFSTTDGDYGYDISATGYPMVWKKDDPTWKKVDGWPEAMEEVSKSDEGAEWHTGLSSKPNAEETEDKESLQRRLDRLNDQYGKTTNPQALARIEDQIAELEGRIANLDAAQPVDPADPNAPAEGGVDTDTHGVAKEGFIIPTGKQTSDLTPEGIAALIESEKEYILESAGKRLVLDSDKGVAEIYTSADSLDNAKAQAGGIGAPEFIDLATGESIPNDKNVKAPENEDGSSDSEEPGGDDAGSDQAVGDADQPADTDADADAAGDSPDSGDSDAPADSEPAADSAEPDKSGSSAAAKPAKRLTLPEKKQVANYAAEDTTYGYGGDVVDREARRLAKIWKERKYDASGLSDDSREKLVDHLLKWADQHEKSAKRFQEDSDSYKERMKYADLTRRAADEVEQGVGPKTPAKKESAPKTEPEAEADTPDTSALEERVRELEARIKGEQATSPKSSSPDFGGNQYAEGAYSWAGRPGRITDPEEREAFARWVGDAGETNNPWQGRGGMRYNEAFDRWAQDKESRDYYAKQEAEKKPEGPQLTPEQIQNIIDSTFENGGGSFDLNDGGKQPTDGYMVATRGNDVILKKDDFRDPEKAQKAIQDVFDKNKELLSKPNMYFGTWVDDTIDEDGDGNPRNEVVIEVSERFEDRDEAIAAGTERNQQAIWDVAGTDEISTGGTGDREEAPGTDIAESMTPAGEMDDEALRAEINDLNEALGDEDGSPEDEARLDELQKEWDKRSENLAGEDGGFPDVNDMTLEEVMAELTTRSGLDWGRGGRPKNEEDRLTELADALVRKMNEPKDEAPTAPSETQRLRGDGPYPGQAGSDEELPELIRTPEQEAYEARAKRSRDYFNSLAGTDKPMDISEQGEPRNSSAVLEVGPAAKYDNPTDPGLAGHEFPSATAGDVDDEDILEAVEPEKAANLPSGLTPTKTESGPSVSSHPEFTYKDSDEDYASEKFMPTAEQRDVVQSVLSKFDTVVQALAGSGKTTTLVLIAKQLKEKFPERKGVYVVFNKKNQIEGERRMPDNFEVLTMDALSYRSLPKNITSKLNNKTAMRRPLDIARKFNIDPIRVRTPEGTNTIDNDDVARDLLKVIDNWSVSADDEIAPKHFEGLKTPFSSETKGVAEAMWADLKDPNGELKIDFNHFTKMWALSKPDFRKAVGLKRPADILFVDEAQDLNPVFSKVIRDQEIQTVVVGDSRQSIYAFRGAEDEMNNMNADATLPLTQSWRFGPQVAGYGNRFLSLLNSPLKIVGGGEDGEILSAGSMEDPDAILTRSNFGALKSILQELGKGRVVGTDKNFKNDMTSFVNSVRALKSGNGQVTHEDLAQYRSWDEIEKDIANGKADYRVEMLANIVDSMGIDEIERAVASIIVPGEDNSVELSPVSYKDGASGHLLTATVMVETRTGKKFPASPSLDYEINTTADGDLEMIVSATAGEKNKWATLNMKDNLKGAGFRIRKLPDGTWQTYMSGDEDKLRDGVARLGGNTQVDVVVSTAHKSKGLEWNKVKIGDDFRGPEVDEEGNTTFPEMEEIRLAYVAVTRAQKQLDPGSLAWVTGYTDDDDERPDVPSRGIPGQEDYDSDPAPAASPEYEIVSDPIPESINPAEDVVVDEPLPEGPINFEDDLSGLSDEEINAEIEAINEREDDGRITSGGELDRREDLRNERDRRTVERAVTSREPTPEPTPVISEPEATPEGITEPAPAPEPDVAPTPEPEPASEPEDEGDGLPDSVEELEDLAGKLERELANARPARRRVLEREIDKIYDKIDSLSEPEEAPEAAPAPEEAVDVPDVADDVVDPIPVEPTAAISDFADRVAAGKDMTPEKSSEIIDRIRTATNKTEVGTVLDELNDLPNRPDTPTTPRPSIAPERSSAARAFEDDPSNVLEGNEFLDEVKEMFPNYTTLDNGDMVLTTRDIGNHRYDVVLRRTNAEEFVVYVKDTNKANGNSRAVRMKNDGVLTGSQSPRALHKQINRALAVQQKDVNSWFNKQRKSVERLAPGQHLSNGTFGGYIEGTDMPETKSDLYNKVVADIARLVDDPDVERSVLRHLATDKGFNSDLAERVSQSVQRRKAADAAGLGGQNAPKHVSYDNDVVEPGQWVDWTDTDKTVAVKDANGKTVYDAMGKALNQPNPNYGRVYRGQVRRLVPRAMTNTTNPDGTYDYSDYVSVIFPEKNKESGFKDALQRNQSARWLKVVDSNAPMSDPFFPVWRSDEEEALNGRRKTAADFGAPTTGSETTPRDAGPARIKQWQSVDPVIGEDGIWFYHPDYNDVRVPDNDIDLAASLAESETITGTRADLQPGDIIAVPEDGLMRSEVILDLEQTDDGTLARVVRTTGKHGENLEEKDRLFKGDSTIVFFRPQPGDFVNPNTAPDLAADHLRGVAAQKSIGDNLKKTLLATLDKPNVSVKELSNVRETLDNLKPRRATKNVESLKNVLSGVHEDSLSNPALGENVDVSDIPMVLDTIDKDLAAPADPNALERLSEDEVKKLIDIEHPVSIPGYTTMRDTRIGDLRRGDALRLDNAAMRALDWNHNWKPAALQIIDVRQTPTGPEYTARVRSDVPHRELEFVDGTNLPLTDGTIVKLSPETQKKMVDTLLDYNENPSIFNLWRQPRGSVADDYDRWAVYRPMEHHPNANKASVATRPVRQVSVYNEAPDQEARTKARANLAEIDKLLADFSPTAPVSIDLSDPQKGQTNLGAGIKKGVRSGNDIFYKYVPDGHDVHEYLAGLVQNAVGLEDMHTAIGKDDEGNPYVVMPAVIYSDGASNRTRMRDILDNFEKEPEAILLGLSDIITTQGDRNGGNYRFGSPDGPALPVDNEYATFSHGKSWFSEFADEFARRVRNGNAPMSSAELLRIRNNLMAYRNDFIAIGGETMFNNMMFNLSSLINGVNGYDW